MKKVFNIILSCFGGLLFLAALTIGAFLIYTNGQKLDESKLCTPQETIIILDEDGNPIIASGNNNKTHVDLQDLPNHTLQAFIAAEDRSFYSHHGINFKRMIKASVNNLFAGKLKEGASTISQQLIKNTHLSHEKTWQRKLYEIRLTFQLEKKRSKNEILECYLNTIYFGHSCYGIEQASQYYFDIPAERLNVQQSATLAGLLSSPNNYSPYKDDRKCLQKRNTVLNAMYECGYLSEREAKALQQTPLEVTPQTTTRSNYYLECVKQGLDELQIDPYRLQNAVVYTYFKPEVQKTLTELAKDRQEDVAQIVLDNKTGAVIAYYSTVGNAKRQPGSTIKPLLVYAPALEKQLITEESLVEDEPYDFNGYKPKNHDGKYHGKVTIKQAISQSLNVPAVKVLNALGLDTARNYAQKLYFPLTEDDLNLNLALGGMTHGVTLKQLSESYQTFANGGSYQPNAVIRYIQANDGQILYQRKLQPQKAFETSTCSLINDVLIQTAKEGTAKKLSDLPFIVAAKTGTCGTEKGNTDAYTVTYTQNHTVAVWLGSANNQPLPVTGGKHCAPIAKEILKSLYTNKSCLPLDTTTGVKEIVVDKNEWQQGNILLADPISPVTHVKSIRVLQDQTFPQCEKFSYPTIQRPTLKIQNDGIFIELCHAEYYNYMIKSQLFGKENILYDGIWQNEIFLGNVLDGSTLSVTPYFEDKSGKHFGKEITFPPLHFSNDQTQKIQKPPLVNKEWFDE